MSCRGQFSRESGKLVADPITPRLPTERHKSTTLALILALIGAEGSRRWHWGRILGCNADEKGRYLLLWAVSTSQHRRKRMLCNPWLQQLTRIARGMIRARSTWTRHGVRYSRSQIIPGQNYEAQRFARSSPRPCQ